MSKKFVNVKDQTPGYKPVSNTYTFIQAMKVNFGETGDWKRKGEIFL